LKPHLKQTWCLGQLTAAFLAQMEDLLALYAQAYDPLYPVICFDERPCFLVGEAVWPLPLQAGRVAKEHYAYEKKGGCVLLAAIEPLTGERLAHVRAQRTKREYTEFCQALAARYPKAKKIKLVQDNLNTHNASSFYEHLPAAEARALAARFEFHYTPKAASWLNMIEIEFSVLSRQCLQRRIPTQEQLEKEVLALVKERANKEIKIHWQFSLEAARTKLNRHYQQVNADNAKYQRT
jgi:transposase